MIINQSAQAEKVLGYFQLSGVAAATGFAAIAGGSIPDGTEFVEVTVGAQAVRWRGDGTNPTAAVGMPLAVGSTRFFTQQQLSAVRFIEQVAGAVLDCTFYGR